MSNNAVLCISNNNKTIRLTIYACKPAVFLMQFEKFASSINDFDIDELVTLLLENGFDLDAETSLDFSAVDMCTSTLVNWAWLFDTENKTLSYWDVTAALNGIQETIEQDPISPLDFANWTKADAAEDYKSHVIESNEKLNNLGIKIINF